MKKLLFLLCPCILLTGCSQIKPEIPLGTYVCEADDTRKIEVTGDSIIFTNMDYEIVEVRYAFNQAWADLKEANNEWISPFNQSVRDLRDVYLEQIDFSSIQNMTTGYHVFEPELGETELFVYCTDENGEDSEELYFSYDIEDKYLLFGLYSYYLEKN